MTVQMLFALPVDSDNVSSALLTPGVTSINTHT